MSKRLDGTSMFTGINSGLTNIFAQLSGQYSDGITLENLNKALTNTNITNTAYGTTFASYLTSNFNSIDKDRDGVISASEVQNSYNCIHGWRNNVSCRLFRHEYISTRNCSFTF